jgi:hypothetical protein
MFIGDGPQLSSREFAKLKDIGVSQSKKGIQTPQF